MCSKYVLLHQYAHVALFGSVAMNPFLHATLRFAHAAQLVSSDLGLGPVHPICGLSRLVGLSKAREVSHTTQKSRPQKRLHVYNVAIMEVTVTVIIV